MFGNLFNFKKESPVERYLFKEFGRKDKRMNIVIRAIPILGIEIYKTARLIVSQNLRVIVEDFGKKFGEENMFMNLDSEKIKKLELEVINYMLFFIYKEIYGIVQNAEKANILTHGIHTQLQKHYYIPEEFFLRYTKLHDTEVDNDFVTNKFNKSLAALVLRRPNVALASAFKDLAAKIQEACTLLVQAAIKKAA